PHSRRSRRSGEVLCPDRQDAPDRPHARARLVRAHERSLSDGPHESRRMERPQPVRSRLNIVIAAIVALLAAASLAWAEPPAGRKISRALGVAPNYSRKGGGPVRPQPAPLPVAPPAPVRASREAEEPEGQAEAAAPKAERQIVRTAKGRERHRTAHAQSRTADRQKSTAARGRNARPARGAARVEKPRAAKAPHAEPHAATPRPG